MTRSSSLTSRSFPGNDRIPQDGAGTMKVCGARKSNANATAKKKLKLSTDTEKKSHFLDVHRPSVVSLSDGSSGFSGCSIESNDQSSISGDDSPSVNGISSGTALSHPRRSSRERKSTIVFIKGQPVLAKNNYVLKGHSYSYGAFVSEEGKNARALPRKVRTKPKTSKKIGAAEIRRVENNNQVKARVVQKKTNRMSFFAENIEVLAPFIEPKVEANLRTFSAGQNLGHEVYMQPDLIQADMRDYQLRGLNWMAKMHSMNLGMILGDEMGLGKTLQTISLFCYLKETEKIQGPSLVICPLSVLYSWCHELSKWAPSLKFLRLHSSSVEEREVQKGLFIENASSYDVVVTTYDMAKNPSLSSLWSRQHFNYVVLDEGHIIKERTTQIAQAVRKLHYENTLILTGTPLQNNLVELWSLLNYLHPDVFTVSEPFAEAFDIGKKMIDKNTLHLAHELLNLFMLRRLKVEVERLMPKKIETKVICPLSTTQIFWYKALLLKDISLLADASNSGGDVNTSKYKDLNNLIMQLRKCCLHPYLFRGAEVDIDSTTCEDLIAASGKLAVLDKLLRSLFKKNHRVVFFSQFTRILDLVEDYCVMRGWNFCRFDGSTPRARRNFIVNQFNAPESEHFIFLMSTRSGGMGLNLQSADTCVLFDSDWNPQPDIQAMARVHRIGQTKTVHVYRLVSGGTIEERIVERAQKKLYLDQMVNRGVESSASDGKATGGLTASDLLDTLRFGCNAVFGDSMQDKNILPTDGDIEQITDRNRSEQYSFGKLKGGVTETAKDFDVDTELRSTQAFGGVDFRSIKDEEQKKKNAEVPKSLRSIADAWGNIASNERRQRKSRVVMLKGKGTGYGKAAVPVLAANNYDLESGESSVFDRELDIHSRDAAAVQKRISESKPTFGKQDFCQICGDDSGDLLRCPRCPVCIHEDCLSLTTGTFLHCSHHWCSNEACRKKYTSAGGLLFCCQSCPRAFCSDCLPSTEDNGGVRLLGKCDRFEKLGFDSTKQHCYIHCSEQCETFAKEQLGWRLEPKKKAKCPKPIDVSDAFGKATSTVVSG